MTDWIKATDRLPDEGVPVWGSAIGQFPMMVAINVDVDGWLWGQVYSYYPKDGQWTCEYELDDDYSWITHCQPLPPPPEEP